MSNPRVTYNILHYFKGLIFYTQYSNNYTD